MSGSIFTTQPVNTGTACVVTSAGIQAPTFEFVLNYFTTQFQAIYGSDTDIDPDTQDGQWLGIVASAVNDQNNATVAAYQNFSPSTAQGAGLSSVIKINNLRRGTPTFSTWQVLVAGTVESNIINGLFADNAGNQWALPASVIIPSAGQIVVTATAQTAGAINLPPQNFRIVNPQQGWQNITSSFSSTPGEAVELDGALRIRQSQSTANATQGITAGLQGDLMALTGVTGLVIFENDTETTNSIGIPAKSIAVVINGGNAQEIAQTIYTSKGQGCGTFGNITENIIDPFGNEIAINFSQSTEVPITVAIAVLASTIPGGGFTSVIGDAISEAVAAFINALAPGADVYVGRLYTPANLSVAAGGNTYTIESILLSANGSTPAQADIAIAFNQQASCTPAAVTVTPS
jgi:hypothetical protein